MSSLAPDKNSRNKSLSTLQKPLCAVFFCCCEKMSFRVAKARLPKKTSKDVSRTYSSMATSSLYAPKIDL